jgi:biotin synthase
LLISTCLKQIKKGEEITFDQALELATKTEPESLFKAADSIRRIMHGDYFDLCSIINAKSGKCSENCKFCAQSTHFDADIERYDIVGTEEAIIQGTDNDRHGVVRLSLVTAGKTATLEQIKEYGTIYQELGRKTGLKYCASMGFLTKEKAELLRSFGVERYHCNLEACRSFFPEVCTSHTWEDKVETINIARNAGMAVCSGGIIGMGEGLEHRIELALELRQLGIKSIPINVLTPIANTPFENMQSLSLSEVLTCVAIFRFINPTAVVRLAGGRNQLGAGQYECFTSGANGAIVGNYLTTAGNSLKGDLREIEKQGFTFKKLPEN